MLLKLESELPGGEGGKNTCPPIIHHITAGKQQYMITLIVCTLNLVHLKRRTKFFLKKFEGNPRFGLSKFFQKLKKKKKSLPDPQ